MSHLPRIVKQSFCHHYLIRLICVVVVHLDLLDLPVLPYNLFYYSGFRIKVETQINESNEAISELFWPHYAWPSMHTCSFSHLDVGWSMAVDFARDHLPDWPPFALLCLRHALLLSWCVYKAHFALHLLPFLNNEVTIFLNKAPVLKWLSDQDSLITLPKCVLIEVGMAKLVISKLCNSAWNSL